MTAKTNLQVHLKAHPELRRMILLSMYAEYVEDLIENGIDGTGKPDTSIVEPFKFGDWAQINGETLLKGE